MKILITGSSGYIGKNLQEYLSGKYTLFTPSHKDLDLLDEEATEKFFKINKIDIVIHCAVVGGSRNEEHEDNDLYNNLRMFFNILKNHNSFKKMIHLGAGAEYDKKYSIIKVKETDFDKKIPSDNYGFYKYVCSKYIEEIDNVVCLRLFGTFGKYEDYRYRFISNAICRNIMGLPITLIQDVTFDYTYIDDFVRIVDYFVNNKARHKFYNIGTGNRINLLQIAEKINVIADRKSAIIVKKRGLGREYTGDTTLLMRELKNFQFMDFEQSLLNLYKWYKSNKKIINTKEL